EHLRDAPAFNRLKALEARHDVLARNTQRIRRCCGGEGVRHAMSAQQIKLNTHASRRPAENEVWTTTHVIADRSGVEIRQRAMYGEAHDTLATDPPLPDWVGRIVTIENCNAISAKPVE